MSQQLRNHSITSDPLGRYYTANWVSETLVNSIDYDRPDLIVELGVGEGSLSNVAMRKWMNSQLLTVDVDTNVSKENRLLSGIRNHVHYNHDVLDKSLDKSIGVQFGSADIALCNPPFIRPRWRNGFKSILSDAGLSKSLFSIYDAGADLLFLAQNLRLLKKSGKLGLVLPDGLITGEKFRGIRQVLLKEHLIEEVIQLPKNAFLKTEAQTYLVVIAKENGPTKEVKLSTFYDNKLSQKVLVIKGDSAIQRLDYKFHLIRDGKSYLRVNEKRSIKLSELCEDISRGVISSNQIPYSEWPTFHLCDFPKDKANDGLKLPRGLRIAKKDLSSVGKACIAKPGDILIGRVGRNLHNKICLLKTGYCIISDCVFRIRVDKEFQTDVFNFLKSKSGSQYLQSTAHGVGASYLNKQDVFDLPIPLSIFR